jgi:hypothetical protein
MSKPFRVTVSGSAGQSSPWNPDYFKASPFAIGVGCVVTTTTATAVNYYVEHSFDPIFDLTYGASLAVVLSSLANWFQNSGFLSTASTAGSTNSRDGNYAFPVTAIRLNVTNNTSQGNVQMSLIQSGM